jgi:hypothetical protein
MADQTLDWVVENSAFYREFLAERNEIMRHKWIQSEAAGHDIGFDFALVDWMINHRASWKKSRFQHSEAVCNRQ